LPTVRKTKKKVKRVRRVRHHLPAGRVQKARHPLISFAILFGGTFLLVSGLWLVSSSGLVANRFKPQLEVELSKALNRQVTIGRLEGGLFDRVVLKDVKISTRATSAESLDITIERVVVQYSLWDILVRKRPLAESLHQIQLIHPLIHLERTPEGKWRGPDLVLPPVYGRTAGPAVPAPSVPHIKIFLIAGEVRITDGVHTASVKNLKGLLNLKDPAAVRLYLSGRTDTHRRQNLKISGILDLTVGSFRLGLNASRVALSPLERVAHVSDFFHIHAGQADLELKFISRESSAEDLIPGVGVKGKLVLYDLTLKTRLLHEPLQSVFGVAHLEDRHLILKSMQAVLGKTAWTACGKIKNLHPPCLDIRVQSNDLELTDLVGAFPNLAQLNTTGSGQAAILIKGQAPDLTVTANFRMPKGKIGRLRIRKFEVITRYRARELRLMLARGVFARGWIEGRGRILFPENSQEPAMLSFRGDAKDLALEDIITIFGLEKVSGRFGGMLTVSGSVKTPILYGEVVSPKIKISGAVFKNIAGKLEYSDESMQLNLNTDWGPLKAAQFKIKTKKQGQGWRVEKFTISQAGRKLLKAGADWGIHQTHSLRGQIDARNLPVQTIPFLPPALQHLNGAINFTGKIRGTTKAPYLLGKFNTRKLIVFPGGNIDAQGEIYVAPQEIQLRKIWLDHKRIGLSGQIGLGAQRFVAAKLKFNQIPLKHLALLSGLNKAERIGGTAQGEVNISGRLKKLRCNGDIRLTNLEWKNLHAKSGVLNFSSNGKRIWIKEMELVQSGGKFSAVLETELGKSVNPFQILAWMKTFKIGKRKWTGDLKIKGFYQDIAKHPKYSARLILDNLEVDGQSLPLANGEVTFTEKKINVQKLNWGQHLTFSGNYILGDTQQGTVQLLLEQSDLGPLRVLLVPGREALNERVSGIFNITFKDRQLNTNLRLHTAQNELNGEMNVRLSPRNEMEYFQGRLQMQEMKTATLFDLFLLAQPRNSPLGTVTGRVLFTGRKGDLDELDGDLVFSKFVFGCWNFKTLKAVWENRGDDLQLKVLTGIQPRGSLRGESGSMHRNADGSFDLAMNLLADNFAFFSRRYHGHFNVNGKLILNPFELRLAVVSPDFKLNRYPFNDFRASVRYWGENLAIRTPADYPYQIVGDLWLPPGGDVIFRRLTISDENQIYIDTRGRIDGKGTSDLRVKVRNVKADVLARALGWPQSWTGVANGSFRYTDPDHIPHFDINVKINNGSVLRLPFDVFYGNIVIDHDWLYFRGPEGTCVLRKHGKYTLLLSGKIPLPQSDKSAEILKGAEMDVHVLMPEGDFSYITFIPYIAKASGKSMLNLRIQGTMDYPALYGHAWVKQGTLFPRFYAPKVENLDAEVTFAENKMYVKRMEATIGKGRLKIRAGPEADWVTVFRRLQPHQLNIKLDSEAGPIHLDTTQDYEFVSADVNINALLTGTLETPVLGGVLEFSDGQFTFPVRNLTEFAKNLKPTNISYNHLKLISRKNIWFYNDVVRAQIKPGQSVVLHGGKRNFSAEGRVTIAKGSFTYLETDFNLDPNEETVVICQGQQKPRLESLAKTVIRNVKIKDEGRMRDAVIYLRVQGTIGALKIKLESDPEMTQAQIMSLLTLGEDFSSWSQEEIEQKIQTAGARVLGRLAGKLIGREIEKSIKKITPLDIIDIRLGGVEKLADTIMTGRGNTLSAENGANSDITGTSILQDTQIDVGKYLTDALFLNYRGILKDRGEEKGGLSWESFFGLEYNLDSSKKIKIYKNFDVDSDQELFWGIEGRVQFEGWSPEEAEKESQKTQKISPAPTPTPGLQ